MKRNIGIERSLLMKLTWLCIALLYVATAVAQGEGDALMKAKQRLLKKKVDVDVNGPTGDSLRTLHLIIGGNIYQTEKHINYCYDEATGTYNFRDELKYIQPILSLGDITIANLKTSFGGDIKNMYSAPDEFALALKYSGINALMNANLHSASVSRESFNRTRDLMNEFDIQYTGVFADNMQRMGNYPLIINRKGFRLAILNYGTLNKRPEQSRTFFINEIDEEQIEKDMRMAKAYKPDFIIVYFDWGANKQDIPTYYQMDLARKCYNLGVNLVVGTHPNEPMRIDMMNYVNANGESTDGIVAYSLGNLVASNDEITNRNGFLIDMELKKNNYTGKTHVGDWGVIPVYTYYDTSSTQGKMKVYTVPCSAVEAGDMLPNIPYIEKRRVVNGAYEIRKMIGGTADEIQYNVNEMVADNVMQTIDLTNAAWNNKYSMKRKEEVKKSEAPVLPVATLGTNNPPSLATIYEEPVVVNKKGASSTTTASTASTVASTPKKEEPLSNIERAKLQAEQAMEAGTGISSSGTSNTNVNPVNLNANTTEANKATGVSVNTQSATVGTTQTGTGISPANAQTAQNVNAPSTLNTNASNGSVASSNTATTAQVPNATSASNGSTPPRAIAGSAASNGTSTATSKPSSTYTDAEAKNKTGATYADDEAAKRRAASEVADDDAAKKRAAAQLAEDEERKRRQATTGGGDDKLGTPADVNYKNPNGYSVDMPQYGNRDRVINQPEVERRADQEKLTAGSAATTGISTGVQAEEIGDMTKVDGKEYTMKYDTVYRVQFYALRKPIPLDTNYYTHLKGYEVIEENGYFKYMLGRFKSYEDCLRFWKSQIQPRYKESFIVKYVDGKRSFE